MFLQAMDYFASDPDTEVLVLVSKPPHPDTARKIYAALPKDKPCVVFFLGGDREEIRRAGAYAPASLEEAAQMAVCLLRGEEPAGGDYLRRATAELAESAAAERSRLSPEQKYLRGLFCGGTHSEEAVTLLKSLVHRLHSNISFGGAELLEDRYLSVENSLVDMGDEVFTKGRPHPVMDLSLIHI